MIEDRIVEQVAQGTDIVALVGERVALRRQGANHVGLCPFHDERTPSFLVNPQRGRYHCFGCGADGDAIEFVRQTQGLDFVEAVRLLASRLGIAVDPPQALSAQQRAQNEQRQRWFDLLARAHERYASTLQALLSDPHHAVSRYCRERGITADVARRHALGFAGAHDLQPWLRDNAQACVQAGLARSVPTPGGDERIVPWMRNRLVFPIRDDKGRVVAFGGRVIPGLDNDVSKQAAPKYLNTPQTDLYHKGEVLFRFHEARAAIAQKKRVIIVEGYMDALALAEAGFEETVACCGTALTSQQLLKLLKATQSAYFVFDTDGAGQRAALRSAQLALSLYQEAISFRFVLLPQGKDPDEFVRQQGAAAFEAQLAGASSLSTYLLHTFAAANAGLRSVEDRARFLAQVRESVYRHTAAGSDFARLLVKEAYRMAYASGQRSATTQGRGVDAPFRGARLMDGMVVAGSARSVGSIGAVGATPPYRWSARPPGGQGQGATWPAWQTAFHLSLSDNTSTADFWGRLVQAFQKAPRTARQMASAIEDLLNVEDRRERVVALALREACVATENPEQREQQDSAIHADFLRSAPKLIARKRLDAALDSLKLLFERGEISEEEYLSESQALIESTRNVLPDFKNSV